MRHSGEIVEEIPENEAEKSFQISGETGKNRDIDLNARRVSTTM